MKYFNCSNAKRIKFEMKPILFIVLELIPKRFLYNFYKKDRRFPLNLKDDQDVYHDASKS